MKSTTNKLISGLTIAVLALALSIGVSYVIAGTYSEPDATSGGVACTPTTPGCNRDAPLNVGGNMQTKTGPLQINWIPSGFATIGLQLNGKIQINDAGSSVNTVGSVLTNQGNGVGMWASPSGGGTVTLPATYNSKIFGVTAGQTTTVSLADQVSVGTKAVIAWYNKPATCGEFSLGILNSLAGSIVSATGDRISSGSSDTYNATIFIPLDSSRSFYAKSAYDSSEFCSTLKVTILSEIQ